MRYEIHQTTSGVTIAPRFVLELKIPVARARSFLGSHSARVLMELGKFPPTQFPERSAQSRTAAPSALEHEPRPPRSKRTPTARNPCESRAGRPHNKKPRGIRDVKREYDVAVADSSPYLALQSGFQQRNHLPVHVVDRRRKNQQPSDRPTSVSYI